MPTKGNLHMQGASSTYLYVCMYVWVYGVVSWFAVQHFPLISTYCLSIVHAYGKITADVNCKLMAGGYKNKER